MLCAICFLPFVMLGISVPVWFLNLFIEIGLE